MVAMLATGADFSLVAEERLSEAVKELEEK